MDIAAKSSTWTTGDDTPQNDKLFTKRTNLLSTTDGRGQLPGGSTGTRETLWPLQRCIHSTQRCPTILPRHPPLGMLLPSWPPAFQSRRTLRFLPQSREGQLKALIYNVGLAGERILPPWAMSGNRSVLVGVHKDGDEKRGSAERYRER